VARLEPTLVHAGINHYHYAMQLPTYEGGSLAIAPGYTVTLATNEAVAQQWNQLKDTMRGAFEGATYIQPGRTVSNGLRHIRRALDGELDLSVGHAVAIGPDAAIEGGIFCVPTDRDPEQTDADIGWVFISPEIPVRVAPKVMDGLVAVVRQTLVSAGYQRLVTQMGSVEGARVFCSRYDVAHAPLPEQPNRYIGSAAIGLRQRSRRATGE
jgi:hypothetical protein